MSVPVERLAADQAARIDVGLHGPSNWSQLLYTPTKVHIRDVGHLSEGSDNRAGRLAVAVDTVRESPSERFPVAPKEQILPGISQAPGTARARSLWKAGRESDGIRSHRR
ncbi:hypothetical protein GCM10010282_68000 [Streptomyces roseolus]|nr:hypothetical protein GCM10010282_68000 [Streptomyces roseolus]